MVNVMLPSTLSNMSGVWAHTDLQMLVENILTAVRYCDEILPPFVRPYAGAVDPGLLLMEDNFRLHVNSV